MRDVTRRRVLLSGASGFIGRHLSAYLRERGDHDVLRLVRRPPVNEQEIAWDPAAPLDPASVSGLDHVVHLASATLTPWSWNKEKQFRDSKVTPTRLLCTALAQAPAPPRSILIASGMGYAGDCGDELIDDACPKGAGFVAEVYRDMEAAARVAQDQGIRVVFLRMALILGTDGGPFPETLRAVRRFSGRIGDGRMWASWLTIDDAVRAIEHLFGARSVDGPVNLVSPNPVRHADYIAAIARALNRSTTFALPPVVLRLFLGRLAEIVLSSYRAVPRRLVESGFQFEHPELEGALKHLLGEPG